mgnify:CR=1 FL=1
MTSLPVLAVLQVLSDTLVDCDTSLLRHLIYWWLDSGGQCDLRGSSYASLTYTCWLQILICKKSRGLWQIWLPYQNLSLHIIPCHNSRWWWNKSERRLGSTYQHQTVLRYCTSHSVSTQWESQHSQCKLLDLASPLQDYFLFFAPCIFSESRYILENLYPWEHHSLHKGTEGWACCLFPKI